MKNYDFSRVNESIIWVKSREKSEKLVTSDVQSTQKSPITHLNRGEKKVKKRIKVGIRGRRTARVNYTVYFSGSSALLHKVKICRILLHTLAFFLRKIAAFSWTISYFAPQKKIVSRYCICLHNTSHNSFHLDNFFSAIQIIYFCRCLISF